LNWWEKQLLARNEISEIVQLIGFCHFDNVIGRSVDLFTHQRQCIVCPHNAPVRKVGRVFVLFLKARNVVNISDEGRIELGTQRNSAIVKERIIDRDAFEPALVVQV
jgi:hypothetical protein